MRMETARNKMGWIAFACVRIELVRSMLMPTLGRESACARVQMAPTRADRIRQERQGTGTRRDTFEHGAETCLDRACIRPVSFARACCRDGTPMRSRREERNVIL